MNKTIVLTLLKKELTDIFRDTKTIIITLFVPLVLYPLIFLGSLLLASNMMKESTTKTYKAAIVDVDSEKTDLFRKLLEDSKEKNKYHFEISIIEEKEDYEKEIRSSVYDVIICPDTTKEDSVKVYSMTSSNKASTAYSMVEKVIDDYCDDIIEERIKKEVEDYDNLTKKPLLIDKINFSSNEETTGMLIGYIMPFMMTICVMMGAFTVAIDVSVGEKERGTLETLITLPISNLEMMVSKFLAVSIFSLFSVFLNVLSYGIIGVFIYNSMKLANTLFGGFKVTKFIPSLLIMVVVVVLFSFFVSSICLCADFTAKSVKEANNLTSVLMIIFMLGAGLCAMPNIKINHILALIPILNVSLLIKDLFMLNYDFAMIMIVISSTVAYTSVAIFIMTKLFSSEDILFNEGLRSVKIFEKRANMKEKQIPGVGDIVFMFALMFLISNFAGGFIVMKLGFVGYAATQLIIFLVPVIYSWYMKTDFVNVYSLKAPRINELIGVLFFVAGSYIFNQIFVTFLISKFPSLQVDNSALNDVISGGGFVGSLFVIGFMPAIAEEAAFRGFLFGTLKNKKIPMLATMIITAVVFAAYHMNMLQFIYVTIMGIIMSYIIFNSKSIFTTVLFHLINNSFSVVLSYKPELVSNVKFLQDELLSPKEIIIMLTIAFALLILGFLISDRKRGFFKVKGKTQEES